MHFNFPLITSLLSVPVATLAYTLEDNCTGSTFQNCFTFFSGSDPTHGFVRYLAQADALSQGLYSVSGNSVTLKVDSTNKAPNGRASLRLESKKLYNRGLFMLDVAHMPSSTCGTWPSFWSWGPGKTWPENGEIDIIEGIHTSTVNAMSLHTADGCTISGAGSLGPVVTKNCFISAAGQTSNAGCGITSSSPSSFGSSLNAAGGGLYAMQWTSTAIKMWFWARSNIPSNAASSAPDPSTWGTPDANFEGAGCDFEKRFVDHRVVVDTTFCGDWGNAVWGSNAGCAKLAASCNDYVANNPGAFAESYWRINHLKVYRE